MPIRDRPNLGRMQKCGDKVKKFYFLLAFWYGSGCNYGVLDRAQYLIGGRGGIYVGMRVVSSRLLGGKQRGAIMDARGFR